MCIRDRSLTIQRHQTRQRLDEPRKGAREPATFRDRFAKTSDVEALQIAQATVNDAQRIAARSTAKVRTLEQQDPQAALGRLQCEAHPMNTAADNGQVEPLCGCGSRRTRNHAVTRQRVSQS